MQYDKYKNPYNPSVDLNSFYNTFHTLKISDIDLNKINELRENSKKFNYFYEGNFTNFSKGLRYIKILNRIKTNPKNNSTEKLLILMFSVDPNFEAILIYNEFNMINEIKFAIEKHFGIYDPNLIRIERWYINNILSKDEKTDIEEKIKKRIYKI